MGGLRIVVLCLCLSLPPGLAAAAQARAISWGQTDLPPQFILDGELAGQGWSEQQMRGLFPLLPGFEHRTLQGSLSRIWYEMAHRDGVCFNGAARTPERESMAVFSRRPIVVPAYRVIVRADALDRFRPSLGPDGGVDLERLAENGALTGGYVSGRAYFSVLNRFIGSDQGRARLESAVSTLQLFNLLHGKRLDYILSSPVEAPYYKARFHLPDEFVSLPVEGGDPSVRGYVVCSKGPLGRAVIEKVDALLVDDRAWAAYLEPLRRWLEPADFAAALAARPEETTR